MKPRAFPRIDKQTNSSRMPEILSKPTTTKANSKGMLLNEAKSSNYQAIYDNLNHKLDDHRLNIDDQSQAIHEITSNFEALKEQIIKEKQLNSRKQQKLEEQSDLIGAQIEEISSIKKQLNDLKNVLYQEKLKQAAPQPKEDDSSKEENLKLQKQIETLNQQNEREAKANKELSKKLEQLQKELALIKANNMNSQNDQMKNLQAMLDKQIQQEKELQQTIQQLQKQIQDQKEIEKEKAAKIVTLNMQNSVLESEKLDLASQVSQMKEQILALKQKIEEMEKDDKSNQLNNQLKKRVQELNDEIKLQINNINSLTGKIGLLNTNIDSLRQEIASLKDELQQTKDTLSSQLALEQNNNTLMLQKLQQDHALEIMALKKQIQELQEGSDKNSSSQKALLKKIEAQIKQLYDAEKEIQKQITCGYCKKQLNEPVTIIPCGHSFCFKCKIGYDKGACVACGPKVKVDSIYRNELMDDIMNLVRLVKQSRELLESKIKVSK